MGILLGSSSWPPLSDLGAFLMKPKLVPSFHTHSTQMSQKLLPAAFRIVSRGSTAFLWTSRGSVPSSIFAQCRHPLDFNWIVLSWAFFFLILVGFLASVTTSAGRTYQRWPACLTLLGGLAAVGFLGYFLKAFFFFFYIF